MQSIYGYNGKILHIDVKDKRVWIETPDENWYRIYAGGGLMGCALLLQGTPPKIDPLGEENLLLFVSSVIAGHNGPGLARFSVVTKSPLTYGIAESRCEGPFGQALKASGYDVVIIHGKSDNPIYICVQNQNVTFHDASSLLGKDTYVTTSTLRTAHPSENTQIAAIGAAGEHLVRYASIVTNYSIQAMRMGTGAVMGSKNLKALVFLQGTLPPVAHPTKVENIKSKFECDMLRNTLSMWQKNPPGFSASADLSDFTTAYIGEHNYKSNLKVANSSYTRAAYLPYYKREVKCPGCTNDCVKIINPTDGPDESAAIHQEVTGALGPNIGNTDLLTMLKANIECNLHGIDPVSLGFTLSFAIECLEKGLLSKESFGSHLISFGQCDHLFSLIEAIAHREGIGDLLAEGTRIAAQKIGGDAIQYALHVKGLEMVSFEPRTQTNLALGYATAPIGPRYDICEHDWDFDIVSGWEHTLTLSRTLGIFDRIPMELVSKEKVRNYKALNTLWSAFDALNFCIFAGAPTRVLSLEDIAQLIHAITGWESSSYEIMRWGERRNHLMRLYNSREGFTAEEDTLPERFFTTPIEHGRLQGTVICKEEFSHMIQTYYEMMGWNAQGIPTEATRIDHHLHWVETFL